MRTSTRSSRCCRRVSSRVSRASSSCRTRSAARVKSTRRFCFVASTPSAIARCVLPVPIGPAKIRFSGAVTHSPRASVWICVALTPSAAVKSKVSSVFTSGKRASRSRWRMTDSCREACSALRTSCR